jgi:xanthine dehydrogenase YagT iron-sulfur-binding subunit
LAELLGALDVRDVGLVGRPTGGEVTLRSGSQAWLPLGRPSRNGRETTVSEQIGERATPGFREEDEGRLDVALSVNGQRHALRIDPRTTLLDCLRETLHLTGTKKGCDHGQCGACTVHIDGRRRNACLTFAAACEGDEIVTIEGIGTSGRLHPMQAAFLEKDAYQCGFCTSGQIMSALALLNEPCGPSDDDVREYMSGNICRCGAYSNIVAAIQHARGQS